jgi:carboxymethylenebutenolidase
MKQAVKQSINRRDFMVSATSAAAFCVLSCDALAQQVAPATIVKALDDPDVIHRRVTFRSGSSEIDGYLARPRKPGRYRIVIVISGNSIDEEYIQNTTAMLAQNGFVGIAPNIYSLQKSTMTAEEKRKIFAERITDERIFQDLQASIDYLKRQPFAKPGRIGIMGFCFGGRCALMFAAQSKEIKAVAPFYGNLRTPPFANRKQDPLDVLNRIRVPVQGHYSDSDAEIPAEQLQSLEQTLKKRHTPVEVFTYKAQHGFFAYTRKTYDKTAAEDSWKRTAEFFQRVLGK